jgi:DMSO reductase anchor subunit
MLIVYGFALLSASVLLVAFMAKMKNAPAAPKWATSKVLVSTILFVSITGIIFGIAFLFQAAFDLRNVHFGVLEAVLLAAAIVVTYLARRKLKGIVIAAPMVTPKVAAGQQ